MESSIAAAAAGYAATPREVSLILSVLATGLQQERRCPLRPDYDISVQHNSSIRMLRQSVLTWLFKIGTQFRQNRETTASGVHIFDRLLSSVAVPAQDLDTVALTCMYIASKLLERKALKMSYIRRYFGEVCTPEDVKRFELCILAHLNWDISSFTAVDFIRIALQVVPDVSVQHAIQETAERINQMVTLDFGYLAHSSSAMGLACITVACQDLHFDVRPLVEGLTSHGIEMDLDAVSQTIDFVHSVLHREAREHSSPETVVADSCSQADTPSSQISAYSTQADADEFTSFTDLPQAVELQEVASGDVFGMPSTECYAAADHIPEFAGAGDALVTLHHG